MGSLLPSWVVVLFGLSISGLENSVKSALDSLVLVGAMGFWGWVLWRTLQAVLRLGSAKSRGARRWRPSSPAEIRPTHPRAAAPSLLQEASAQRRAQQSQVFFDESIDALFLVDAATMLTVDCNQRAVDLFEATDRQELIGIEGHTLQKQQFTPEELEQINQALTQQGFWSLEIEYLTRRGSPFWGRLTAKPIQIAGERFNLVSVTDISDRKHAELENVRLRHRLQFLLTQTPAVIFTCQPWGDYAATFISDNVQTLLGYRPEAFLAASDFWVKHIHPDDVAVVLAGLPVVFEQGHHTHEYRFLHQDGSYRWVQAGLALVRGNEGHPDELVGYLIDICDRKGAEDLLRQSEERYRAIVEDQTELITRFRPDGTLLFVNEAYCRYFGISKEQFIGCDYHPVVYPDDQAVIDRCLATLTPENSVVTLENRVVLAGEVRWTQWVNRAIYDEQGTLVEMQSVGRDIHDQKQAELALKQAKEAADAANQAKSQFIANISHELRSPLNAILGFARILKNEPDLSAEQHDYTQIIEQSGEHLLKIINQVLDWAKIEANHLTLTPTPTDLQTLLNRLQTLFGLKAANRAIDFVIERDPALPRHVSIDSIKLQQVLINLLDNAFKFTQRGRVGLKVTCLPMPDRQQVRLQFAVEDTGPGIAVDEQALLFLPFSQTQVGQASHSGTGLGLAISQEYVRLMGGTLTVESRPQEGSTFRFDIVACQEDPVSKALSAQRKVIGLAPGQPAYRLLVVDDNAVNRRLLLRVLSVLDLEVQQAENGAEAVALWESWHPHAVLMDLRMPKMDGYAATEQIRQREAQTQVAPTPLSHTVIIAISATTLTDTGQQLLQAGFDSFVAKPFKAAEVFNSLQQLMGLEYLYAEPAAASSHR